MFKAVKSFLNWYKNLGIKSYDKESRQTRFSSGVPITLRRDDVDPSTQNKCLGVKTSGSSIFYANFLPCTRPDVIWRSEIKQRDIYTRRLYRVQRFSSKVHQNYASELLLTGMVQEDVFAGMPMLKDFAQISPVQTLIMC